MLLAEIVSVAQSIASQLADGAFRSVLTRGERRPDCVARSRACARRKALRANPRRWGSGEQCRLKQNESAVAIDDARIRRFVTYASM